MSQRNKPVLPHLIPCLDAGGGMILRAIGSSMEGSSSLSGSLLPSSETNSVAIAENALLMASSWLILRTQYQHGETEARRA